MGVLKRQQYGGLLNRQKSVGAVEIIREAARSGFNASDAADFLKFYEAGMPVGKVKRIIANAKGLSLVESKPFGNVGSSVSAPKITGADKTYTFSKEGANLLEVMEDLKNNPNWGGIPRSYKPVDASLLEASAIEWMEKDLLARSKQGWGGGAFTGIDRSLPMGLEDYISYRNYLASVIRRDANIMALSKTSRMAVVQAGESTKPVTAVLSGVAKPSNTGSTLPLVSGINPLKPKSGVLQAATAVGGGKGVNPAVKLNNLIGGYGLDRDTVMKAFNDLKSSYPSKTADEIISAIKNNIDDNKELTFKRTGFASGGFISGPGTKTSDSIPALLSRGEYVIPANVVDRFGPGAFDALVKNGVSKFASGGLVGGDSSSPAAVDFSGMVSAIADAVANALKNSSVSISQDSITAIQGAITTGAESLRNALEGILSQASQPTPTSQGAAVRPAVIEEMEGRISILNEKMIVNQDTMLTTLNSRFSEFGSEMKSDLNGWLEPRFVQIKQEVSRLWNAVSNVSSIAHSSMTKGLLD
jgi:hypothetical protein